MLNNKSILTEIRLMMAIKLIKFKKNNNKLQSNNNKHSNRNYKNRITLNK